jgi:hypothetical protein
MRFPRSRVTTLAALAFGAGVLISGQPAAKAAPFLPTYSGPDSAALALDSIGVTFNGSVFDLSSTTEAAINSAPSGSLYVWGVNRGAGTARFFTSPPTSTSPDIGSNVLFDSVLLIKPSGSASINLFNGTTEAVPNSDITITGRTISASIPASLLPSTGFLPSQYGFDLWPRSGAGQNDQIAQFFGASNAIDPPDVQPTSVPEPASWAVLATGLALLMAARRKTPNGTSEPMALTSVT